jgi:AcrR family transcriptional regulator
MSAIGSEAGLSAGTPAYFFRSKEGLYRAVLSRAFDETSELIRAWRVGEVDVGDAIREAVGSYVDFLAAHPNFVRLVIRDALEGGRFLQGLPAHVASLSEALPRLAGEQEGGRLRDGIDPAHLLLSGISLCWFPMVATALTRDLGFEADSAEFIEARKRQVSELILGGAFQ